MIAVNREQGRIRSSTHVRFAHRQPFVFLIRNFQNLGYMGYTSIIADRFMIKCNYNNVFSIPPYLCVRHSLPWDIQSAVCNDKMKIFDDLYNILFTEGAW